MKLSYRQLKFAWQGGLPHRSAGRACVKAKRALHQQDLLHRAGLPHPGTFTRMQLRFPRSGLVSTWLRAVVKTCCTKFLCSLHQQKFQSQVDPCVGLHRFCLHRATTEFHTVNICVCFFRPTCDAHFFCCGDAVAPSRLSAPPTRRIACRSDSRSACTSLIFLVTCGFVSCPDNGTLSALHTSRSSVLFF